MTCCFKEIFFFRFMSMTQRSRKRPEDAVCASARSRKSFRPLEVTTRCPRTLTPCTTPTRTKCSISSKEKTCGGIRSSIRETGELSIAWSWLASGMTAGWISVTFRLTDRILGNFLFLRHKSFFSQELCPRVYQRKADKPNVRLEKKTHVTKPAQFLQF